MLDPWDGVFYYAAPGFESYARMQRYHGRLPGYQEVFHAASMKGYPEYRIKPRFKASTVWRLVDRDAVQAMGRSPDRIELGDVADVVYTTHGWGEYVAIDGKAVVAATDVTNRRYRRFRDKPFEDTSVSFFLDDRQPTSVEIDIYATHPTTLEFYWNLDLYAYDRPVDRGAHAVGTYPVTSLGWQTVRLTIPPGVSRRGLNKLGFRAATFQPLVVCPAVYNETSCAAAYVPEPPPAPTVAVRVVRGEGPSAPVPMRASMFAAELRFNYPR